MIKIHHQSLLTAKTAELILTYIRREYYKSKETTLASYYSIHEAIIKRQCPGLSIQIPEKIWTNKRKKSKPATEMSQSLVNIHNDNLIYFKIK